MTDETPDAPRPDDGPADDALPEHEVERLRALLAAPAAPEGAFDRARAAALDAFDEVHGAEDATAAPVRDLGAVRARNAARKAAWYQRAPLGAAAAVVAAVALVGVFSQLDLSSSDGDDMATAALDADDSGDSGDSGDESGDSAFTAEEQAGLDAAAPGVDGSGTFDGDGENSPTAGSMRAVVVYPDVDALFDDYQRRFEKGDDSAAGGGTGAPADTTSSDAAEFENSPCDPVDAAGVDPDRVVTIDPVQLADGGESVGAFAVVYESETNRLRVAVVDEASCEARADRAL